MKHFLHLYIFSLITSIFFFSCDIDEEVNIVDLNVITDNVVTIGTTAVFNFEYEYPKEVEAYLIINNTYGSETYHDVNKGYKSQTKVSDLIIGNKYSYCYELYSGGSRIKTNEKHFETIGVKTTSVNDIGDNYVTITGEVFGGGESVTARGFCLATHSNPTITNGVKTTNGAGKGTFNGKATGLTKGTTYYARAYATNSIGTIYGELKSFTTFDDVVITTKSVSGITKVSANSGGDITRTGGNTITERGICWSTKMNPTIIDSKRASGSTNSYVCGMTGLTKGTTYYVRAYATTKDKTYYASQQTFTTLDDVTITTSDVSNIAIPDAIGGGTVVNDGGSPITSRGVCWSWTTDKPTITNTSNYTSDGNGTGSFSSHITNLQENKTYYVRAYATNSTGTYYGDSKILKTGNGVATITTTEVSNITATTAVCGGTITNDGGAAVTARGVCWSTNNNPTISNSHTSDGTGSGFVSSNITGLTKNSAYYVRAYVTNVTGTYYGDQVRFNTISPISIVNGAIQAEFSVSATKKVYFSMGNLQFNAVQGTHQRADGTTAQGTWRFAEHQYDTVGYLNKNISATYDGWIDLFGWGTSGYHNAEDTYNTNYYPYSNSTTTDMVASSNYYGYGPSTNMTDRNLVGTSANYDWGVYNAISNGGNAAGLWRTLTDDEWVYLFEKRANATSLYFRATVNGVPGLVILPDYWQKDTWNSHTNVGYTLDVRNFTSNVYSANQWEVFNTWGAIFLAAVGWRHLNGNLVGCGEYGEYLSSTSYIYDSKTANCLSFYDKQAVGSCTGRFVGASVRLVQDVK